MTKPFKLRVLTALTDALKEITPANGYVSDLSDFDPGDGVDTARVYRGRAWFGENDPTTMVSILEGTDPAAEVGEPPIDTTTGEYDWPILVQGWVTDDAQNPTDPAYVLLADVRRRLAAERSRKAPGTRGMPDPLGLGMGNNRVSELTIGPGVVRPADDLSSSAWWWLSLTIRVVDRAADPYG